ncbi:MAG TPA: bacterial transcriptional activator domain-containing protein [Chloroflexia bacterium]
MSGLSISLFGGVRIVHAAWPSEMKVTRTVQALLAYLLVPCQRSHHREVLAGVFWGDHNQQQAHGCLSTALWRLRAILEPPGIPRGSYLKVTPSGEISFNWESDHHLDVSCFETQASRSLSIPADRMTSSDVQELEGALALYTGDLLEGFYDDWVLRERERERALYLNALLHLMNYHGYQANYAEGLAHGRQILQHDPLREDIHRAMMHLYLRSDQRALAARQYEACRQFLAAELGIEPMEETRSLYEQVLSLNGEHAGQATPGGDHTMLSLLQHLRLASQGFEEAHHHLNDAILLIERTLENERETYNK